MASSPLPHLPLSVKAAPKQARVKVRVCGVCGCVQRAVPVAELGLFEVQGGAGARECECDPQWQRRRSPPHPTRTYDPHTTSIDNHTRTYLTHGNVDTLLVCARRRPYWVQKDTSIRFNMMGMWNVCGYVECVWVYVECGCVAGACVCQAGGAYPTLPRPDRCTGATAPPYRRHHTATTLCRRAIPISAGAPSPRSSGLGGVEGSVVGPLSLLQEYSKPWQRKHALRVSHWPCFE